MLAGQPTQTIISRNRFTLNERLSVTIKDESFPWGSLERAWRTLLTSAVSPLDHCMWAFVVSLCNCCRFPVKAADRRADRRITDTQFHQLLLFTDYTIVELRQKLIPSSSISLKMQIPCSTRRSCQWSDKDIIPSRLPTHIHSGARSPAHPCTRHIHLLQ